MEKNETLAGRTVQSTGNLPVVFAARYLDGWLKG